MHVEAMEAVRQMQTASGYIRQVSGPLAHPRRGLDIGGADVNGTARSLIPVIDEWVGLDITPGLGVDIVADATSALDMRNKLNEDLFDVVLCTEVLEHVARWPEVVQNVWRFLAPGGFAFITAAGTDGATWARRPHGARGELNVPDGEHYENVNARHLNTVIRNLAPLGWDTGGYGIRTRPNPGDVYAWIRKD